MTKRATISDTLQKAGNALRSTLASRVAEDVQKWLEANREPLLATIRQAHAERGKQLLQDLCTRVPLIAGVVEMAMRGTPETAIAAIGGFDKNLATELRKYQKNFEELQRRWLEQGQ